MLNKYPPVGHPAHSGTKIWILLRLVSRHRVKAQNNISTIFKPQPGQFYTFFECIGLSVWFIFWWIQMEYMSVMSPSERGSPSHDSDFHPLTGWYVEPAKHIYKNWAKVTTKIKVQATSCCLCLILCFLSLPYLLTSSLSSVCQLLRRPTTTCLLLCACLCLFVCLCFTFRPHLHPLFASCRDEQQPLKKSLSNQGSPQSCPDCSRLPFWKQKMEMKMVSKH